MKMLVARKLWGRYSGLQRVEVPEIVRILGLEGVWRASNAKPSGGLGGEETQKLGWK